MNLTPKQDRFCQEYLIDLNATQAAIRVGYAEKSARITACKMLTNTNIEERIQQLKKQREKRTEITQDMVLQELKILAFSDFRDYGEIIKELGIDRLKLKTFKDIKGEATRAIKSISEKISKDGVNLSFKLHGKTHAIELLGKHLGMFIDKVEHSGLITFELSDKFLPKAGNEKK